MDENSCGECIKFRDKVNKIDINKNKIVHGFGNWNSEILFIGEGPGRWGAAITSIPFTKDSSGRIVQKALVKLEFSNNNYEDINKKFRPAESSLKCVLTNVFRCYSYKIVNNEEMEQKYRLHCLEHLKNEVNKINNLKKIIIIGKDSTKKLMDSYLNELREKYDTKVITHPSYFKNFFYQNHKHLSEDECVLKFIEEFESKNKEIEIIA